MHLLDCALALAADRAGKSTASRMAMIAITTSRSINVNALEHTGLLVEVLKLMSRRGEYWAGGDFLLVIFFWGGI
jgi:hypothetical protein